MKSIEFKSILFATALIFVGFASASAQVGTTTGQDKPSGDITYCDEALPALEKEMKTDANANCTTQTACVECMDRASKMVYAATLVVQPDKAECKPVVDIKTETANTLSRGADTAPPTKKKRRAFNPKIIQSPCFAGGNNLSVYVPGYGMDSREFSYLWEVDGGKGGHLPNLQCACGKEAKVRVTHLATGESVTLVLKLNATCANTSNK